MALTALAVLAGSGPAVAAGSAAAVPPSSAVRAQEWWLARLDVAQAWPQARGAGVTVAVLGTGVAAGHPDLAGQVVTGPDYSGSGRTPGGPYWGIDGTQVAAVIAGHGHGPGGQSGLIGVAPAARILSVRVNLEFNDPLNTDPAVTRRLPAAIADGITYAVSHGARVIDLPLDPGTFGLTGHGDPAAAGGSPAEQAAVSAALRHGVVLVAPAGDDGEGPGLVNYPAAYPGVIAVGALSRDGRLAPFSSRRSYVLLTAPGVSLTVAAPAGYGTISSTSTASGIVAGLAALLLSRFPQLTVAQVTQALVRSTTTAAVTDGAAGPGTGYGTPDAARAIALAAGIVSAAQPGPAATPAVTPPGRSHRPAPRRVSTAPRRANASALARSLVRDIVAALGVLIVLVVVLLLIMSSRRRRVLAGPAAQLPAAQASPPGRSPGSRGQHGHRRAGRRARPGPAQAARPPLAPAAGGAVTAAWPAPGGWQGGGVGEIAAPPASPGRPAVAPAPRPVPAGRSRGGSSGGGSAGPPWAPAPEPEPAFGGLGATSAPSFTPEPAGGIRVSRDVQALPASTGPRPAAFGPAERPAGFTAPPSLLGFAASPPAPPAPPPDPGAATIPGFPRLVTGPDPGAPAAAHRDAAARDTAAPYAAGRDTAGRDTAGRDTGGPVLASGPPARPSPGYAAAPMAMPAAGAGSGWDLADTDVFPLVPPAPPDPPPAPDDDAPGASGS